MSLIARITTFMASVRSDNRGDDGYYDDYNDFDDYADVDGDAGRGLCIRSDNPDWAPIERKLMSCPANMQRAQISKRDCVTNKIKVCLLATTGSTQRWWPMVLLFFL